jgi:hypothetical protein
MSWRTPAQVLQRWASEEGVVAISEQEMEPYFAQVESRISVALQDPETIGQNMRLLKAGADAKGWKIIPNLRNQLHCAGTSNCTNGCPTGAKRSMLVTSKFIKAFYFDRSGQPFGCNTPVAQNGLAGEWLPRPSAEQPKRYAFFRVEPADPDASAGPRHSAALLDYGRGGNRAHDVSRILRDYLVRVEPGSDDLLLGKAYFVIAGARLASSFFLIERYRPLPDAAALAGR